MLKPQSNKQKKKKNLKKEEKRKAERMVNAYSTLMAVGAVLAAAPGTTVEARLGGNRTALEAANAADPEKVTSIGSTLHGVDILTFHPDDPSGNSLRQAIFDGLYSEQRATLDGKWLVPDGTDIVDNFNCDMQSSAMVVSGEKSYQDMTNKQLSFKASGGVGPVKGGLKFSAASKKVSEGTKNGENIYTFTQMLCRLYKIQLQTNNLPPFTKGFVNGLQSLRHDNSTETLSGFVEDFGTHYITATSLGSKYVQSFQSDREQTSMLKSSSTSMEAGASVSAWGASVDVSVLSEKEKSEKESFDSLSSEFSVQTLGASIPKGDSREAIASSWVEQTKTSNSLQMVSDYEFAGIDGLFAPGKLANINANLKRHGLKEMTKVELAAIQNRVKRGIEDRCEMLGFNCEGPTDDIPLPEAAKVTPVPNEGLPIYGQRVDGSNFLASGDVGALFGKPGKQTADMAVSRVQIWTKADKAVVSQGTPFFEGFRVYYRDSTGAERGSDIVGKDTASGGKSCEIEIPKGTKVGSIDVHSGSNPMYMEIFANDGKSLGNCGEAKAGPYRGTVNFLPDEQFNGFFGRAGDFIGFFGIQKTTTQVFH